MTSWMRRRLSDDWFKFFFGCGCSWVIVPSWVSDHWNLHPVGAGTFDDFPFPSQRFGWEMFSRTLEATNLSGFADLFGIYNVKLIGSPQSPQKSFLIARLVKFGEAVGVLIGLWVLFSFCEWLIFLFGGLQEALQEFWVFFWGWHYWNIWAQCVINLFLAEISWTLRSVDHITRYCRGSFARKPENRICKNNTRILQLVPSRVHGADVKVLINMYCQYRVER